MKPSKLFMLAWVSVAAHLSAQDAPKTPDSSTTTPSSVIITSEVLRMDMVKKEAVFTTNVIVTDQDFKLKTDELTVYFGTVNGQVDRLLARGNVVIEQPDRTAKANQAEYFRADDRMLLTGSPDILQKDGSHVSGSTITIYKSSGKMQVDGHSRMVLFKDSSATLAPAPAPAPPQ